MATHSPRPTPKVFLDSSVLMAAALSHTGRAYDLVLAGLGGAYQLHISTLVLRETEANIRQKAPHAHARFVRFTDSLPEPIRPPVERVREAMQLVDVKDAPIVAAAVVAGVDYLASDDRRHLLAKRMEIEQTYGIVVATPDEIMQVHAGHAQ